MTRDLESLPLVGRVYGLGVHPLTTTLVLVGPVVVVLVGIVGRHPLTVALGSAYVLSLPASVAYFRLTGDAEDDGSGEASDDGSSGDESSSDETEESSSDGPAESSADGE